MQLALGVIGGAVGGFFGGAPGAQAGFLLGSMIGALLFQPKPPELPDLKIQSGGYGKFIPRLYGRYRVAGTVIWAGPATQVTEDKKKAPMQAAIIPLAIALCRGPITGVTRIWANSKLVYDVTNPANFQSISGSAQMISGFTVYNGDENQMPDATMQSYLGTGNVPAHRGMAYVVFSALDLLNYGNVIPQFEFEVTTAAVMNGVGGIASSFSYSFTDGQSTAGAWQMPNITASGGIAMGVAQNPFGASRAIEAQMSAYGSTQLPSISSSFGYNPLGDFKGTSDVPGFIDINNNRWVMVDATYSTFASGFFSGSFNSYWRNGADFYASGTSSLGASRPVVRSSMPAAFKTVQPAGIVLATSVSIANGFTIVGGTASYVYAAGGDGNLYRLDRNTLATVTTWPLAVSVVTGAVLDDDHIFLYAGGSGQLLYMFRPSQNTTTQLGSIGDTNPYSMTAISQNLVMWSSTGTAQQWGNPYTLRYFAVGGLGNGVPLSAIVSDVCQGAGLLPTQFDVSQLTDTVLGYAVTNYASGRAALDYLMAMYFFDAVDSEGKIKFVKRGGAAAVTVPWSDLGVVSGGNSDPIQEQIDDTHTLPRSFTLTYKGASTDYLEATQRAFRSTTQSNLDSAAQVAIVLADGEAATRVQSMLWTAWMNRRQFSFSTTMSYLVYEPTDVVTLTDQDGTQYQCRLEKCQYDGKGMLAWTAAYEGQTYPNLSQFIAGGGASAGFTKQTLPYSGPSILVPLNVPPLRNQDTAPGIYLAACGLASSWPGIAVEVSRDGSTYSSLTTMRSAATMGIVYGTLGAWASVGIPDESNTIVVNMNNGTLGSISMTAALAGGSNVAYVGGEILIFRNAVLTAANQYTLSGLLRGLYGTEAFVNAHAADERFVLLDPTKLYLEGLQVTDLGNTLYYEYQLADMFYAQPTPIAQQQVTNGCCKPFSPPLLRALYGSASSLNDVTVNWIRRARVNNQWVDGADVPLDESAETYQVYVYAGTTLKRTTVVSGPFTATNAQPSAAQGNPTWVYTDANIQADGFGVKGSGQTITIKVAQNSDQGLLGDLSTTTIVR
ncbi:phage tail protein [Burkholderia sp. JKS000303]|uniref:phage tail protein n=1 Tax=Burkholderia sp. JKS000303 TaxID=1938747 RepID=UPI000BF8ABD2|nr:phage tail protein [Burkholderia sp. JKS000303]PFH13063.1 putative tail protein [Burkholderia sp. JKS000303]